MRRHAHKQQRHIATVRQRDTRKLPSCSAALPRYRRSASSTYARMLHVSTRAACRRALASARNARNSSKGCVGAKPAVHADRTRRVPFRAVPQIRHVSQLRVLRRKAQRQVGQEALRSSQGRMQGPQKECAQGSETSMLRPGAKASRYTAQRCEASERTATRCSPGGGRTGPVHAREGRGAGLPYVNRPSRPSARAAQRLPSRLAPTSPPAARSSAQGSRRHCHCRRDRHFRRPTWMRRLSRDER
jgi:hypothetical protein